MGQARLRAHAHEVSLYMEWLDGIRATKRIPRDVNASSGYNFKHRVEDWLRAQGRPCYISNGSFIAAAIGTGRYRFAIRDWNVCFGFSSKGPEHPKPFA